MKNATLKTTKMETATRKIEELKKGNIVLFYGEQFEILTDSKNFGDDMGVITNTITDVWLCKCKILTAPKDSNISSLLKNYTAFQGNGKATEQVIVS